jgi:hypothetical protein
MSVKWDTRELDIGITKVKTTMDKGIIKPILDVALEILRLSTSQVPHDKGLLMGSGTVQKETDTQALVGYNKVYAARLHEHPEYKFQKGRKGKYLEDPIKNNLSIFKKFIENGLNDILR